MWPEGEPKEVDDDGRGLFTTGLRHGDALHVGAFNPERGGLQVFAEAYIITNGGPADATNYYVFYLYNQAFRYSQLGAASAMAWVLFVVTLVLSALIFWTSRRWVNYETVA